MVLLIAVLRDRGQIQSYLFPIGFQRGQELCRVRPGRSCLPTKPFRQPVYTDLILQTFLFPFVRGGKEFKCAAHDCLHSVLISEAR